MTVSGAWSRYRRAWPSKAQRLSRWQRVLADAPDQNLAIGVRAAVADHLGRAPTRAELTAARRAAHSLAALGRARAHHVPDAENTARDRTYLVLAKPNVIMNEIRLRGLAVAGGLAAGRKRPPNHAQTVRNLRRTLRNAAVGCPANPRGSVGQQIGYRSRGIPLRMRSQSFAGSSSALIAVSGVTRPGRTLHLARSTGWAASPASVLAC